MCLESISCVSCGATCTGLQWAGMCHAVGTVGSKGIVWPMCSLVRLKMGRGGGGSAWCARDPARAWMGGAGFCTRVCACLCVVRCPCRPSWLHHTSSSCCFANGPSCERGPLSVCRTGHWHSCLAGPASFTTRLAWQCFAPCLALCSDTMQHCQNVTASCCMPLRPPQECKHAAGVLWVVV